MQQICQQQQESRTKDQNVNKIMRESYRLSRIQRCQKHNDQLVSICVAPQCFNFRQMCKLCELDDSHHKKMHYPRDEAFLKVQQTIDNLFKGLKALRLKILQTMDTRINSQHGLNEIQEKLEQIKKILNNKIDNFHSELRKIYEKNVKQKLNELYLIVEKSYEFLEQQKIKLYKNQKLKPFFVNDLRHDLKYYQSYYEQILQKNIRRFKAGFQHDKVLKLMVSFQQNLSEIFKFQTFSSHQNLSMNHIMSANSKGNSLFKMKGNSLMKSQLHFMQGHQTWIGMLPSVYYAPKDCYYLIGDGQRQSNKIRRMNIQNGEVKQIQVRMETKRMNFAICIFNQEIFIIGGENSKEGCLSKCQKFIPSEGKAYLVSSLNQKSAQHTLCVYKNKFILKFGGTDIMGSFLEAHPERYYQLHPEIYFPETQQWKILTFQKSLIGSSRINFGLFPGVFTGDDKVIILSGQMVNKKQLRYRYDIEMQQSQKQLKQLKITSSRFSLQPKNLIFSDCYAIGEDDNIYFAVLEYSKGANMLYVASISKEPTQNYAESTKI